MMKEFKTARSLQMQIGQTPGAGDRGAIAANILRNIANLASDFAAKQFGARFKVVEIREDGGKMKLTATAVVPEQAAAAADVAMDHLVSTHDWITL